MKRYTENVIVLYNLHSRIEVCINQRLIAIAFHTSIHALKFTGNGMHRTSRRKLPLSEKLDGRTKKSLRPIFRRKVNPPLGIPSITVILRNITDITEFYYGCYGTFTQ